MKNKYLLLFSIIVLVLSLFSCPDHSLKVTFISYDNSTGKYTTKQDVKVKSGDLFGEVNKPTPASFDKEGWSYSFKHWTATDPIEGTIDTDSEALDDNTEIKENKTVYAVYNKVEIKYKVTFKSFSTTNPGYNNSVDATDIKYGTLLKNVPGGLPTIPQIDDYLGKKYTFKHWTTETPTTSDVKTTGDDFGNETQITADITLYAVYTSEDVKYTVTFKYFNGSAYENKSEKDDVLYNTKLNDIAKTITLDPVVIGGTQFTLFGWADVSSSSTIFEDYKQTKVDENTPITSDKTFCAIYQGDYLCFKAAENTEISFDIRGTLDNPISLQYRKDSDKEFKDYTWGGNKIAASGVGLKITLSTDEKVYFKGKNTTFSKGNSNFVKFVSSHNIESSGSVMSLLNVRDTVLNSSFYSLFDSNTMLLTAPELPAENLAEKCYTYMFFKCTSLKTAPELPARTLAQNCYSYMFYDCRLLTTAPELLATTLTSNCYRYMFSGCTALKSVTCYATNISATDCTSNWLENVALNGTFKCKSTTPWTTGSSSGIPSGWSRENI